MSFTKRVYSSRKKIFLYGSGSIIALLTYLSLLGYYGIDIHTSGDIQCLGTIEEPCVSFINITTSEYSLTYPKSVVYFGENPPSSYELYKKDTLGRWRSFNISGKTMRNYTRWELKLVGYKQPNETLKWGFSSGGVDKDPLWNGYSKQDFFTQLYWNKADLTYGEASFQFCNPTSVSLPFNRDKLSLLFLRNHGEIRDVSLSYLKTSNTTISENMWIANASIVKRNVSIIDNVTGLNITTFFNESRDDGWYTSVNKTVTTKTYLPVPAVANIPAGRCFDVLIHAEWNPAYRENRIEVDWIPKYAVGTTSFMREEWSWWNTSWSYKQTVTINGSASALTNYQINLKLNISNVGAHWNWSNNGSDVRITNSSDIQQNFWVESWNASGSNNISIWLNASSLAVGTNTFYVYYGNPAAVSASNITTTMVFGDDFSGSSIDTSKWRINNQNFSVGNGFLNMTLSDAWINSTAMFSQPLIIETYINLSSLPTSGFSPIGFWKSTTDSFNLLPHGGDVNNDYVWNNSASINLGRNFPTNRWMRVRMIANNSLVTLSWYNGTSTTPDYNRTFGNAISSEAVNLGRSTNWATGESYLNTWDWIFIRQHAAPEPIVLSVGVEEGFLGTKSFFLNLTTSNKTYEQYNLVGIYANTTTTEETICLSSSHPRKGSLYKCGTGNVSDTWIANNTQNSWSNNQTSWMQSLSSAGSLTFNLTMDKYASAKGIYLNVSATQRNISSFVSQTSANQSLCIGSWWAAHPCANLNDNNIDSYGVMETVGTATRYENYTQPTFIYSAFYEIKYNSVGVLHNVTVPLSCINKPNNVIEFKVDSVWPSGSAYYCLNITNSWIFVENALSNSDAAYIYELGIWWEIASGPEYYPKNVSIDFLNDGSIDKQTIGDYINNTIRLSWFNDSTTSKSIQFNTTDQYAVYYLRMPKSGINITSAKVDVNTTLQSGNTTFGCTSSGVSCSASYSGQGTNCGISGTTSNMIDGSFDTQLVLRGQYGDPGNPFTTTHSVSFNATNFVQNYGIVNINGLRWSGSFSGQTNHSIYNRSSSSWYDSVAYSTSGTYSTNAQAISNAWFNSSLLDMRVQCVGCVLASWASYCVDINRFYEVNITLESQFQTNYSFDAGFDGSIELNELRLASGVTQANFTQGLTNYLVNCTADSLGVCTVPVYYSSKVPMSGVLQNLEINYTINPLSLSASALNSYLSANCTGTAANTTCNIPIKISSSAAGNISASNMLDYEGWGSYQWNLTDNTGATVYDSRTVNVTSSRINRTYPTNVRYVEFIPRTRNDVNVSAYGQSSTVPIWNFTWYNYKVNANMTLWLNNTYSDVNISAGTNCSNPGSSTMLTTTQWQVFSNVSFNTNNGLCLWAHYYNSTNRFRVFTFFYKTFCLECW